MRRDACTDYLVTVDGFIESARELIYRLEHGAMEPDREAAHVAYLRDWQLLQRACAKVAIVGPGDLSTSAENLKLSLGTLGNVCDAWYEAAKKGTARGKGAAFETARESAEKTKEAFESTAREYAFA